MGWSCPWDGWLENYREKLSKKNRWYWTRRKAKGQVDIHGDQIQEATGKLLQTTG